MSELVCAACRATYQNEMDENEPDGCPNGETHLWVRRSATGPEQRQAHSEEEILREIRAQGGDREHILMQLWARNERTAGVTFVAREFDLIDAPLEEQVQKFIEDVDRHAHEYAEREAALEAEFGDMADVLLAV